MCPFFLIFGHLAEIWPFSDIWSVISSKIQENGLYPDLEIITALLGTQVYGRNSTANAVSFDDFLRIQIKQDIKYSWVR